MRVRLLAPAVVCCLFSSLALAADWPQFRGPKRDGVSPETGLLKTWPKNGPPLLWSIKNAGLGFSSFAIVEGTLYTLGTRGDDEVVLALDANKGTELWTAKIGPIFTTKGNIYGDGPRSTPTVDGAYLYALGGQGTLVCLDRTAKGKEIWRKSLPKDLQGKLMETWGYSESPLIDGAHVIVSPGGAEGTLAALDKKTGAVVWRSKELTNEATYSSPVSADIQGVRQYVQTSYLPGGKGGVVSGIAAKDGKLLWSAPILSQSSYGIVPTPVVKGNLVYVTSGYGGLAHLIQVGPGQKAKELYKRAQQRTLKSSVGGVVLVGDHVYGHSEPSLWVCQELKSGDEGWIERDALKGRSGSLLSAAGMLYLYSDEGQVGLVEADPKEFKLVSSFTIPAKSKFPETRTTSKQSKVWTYPALANGRLYLRDGELIFCYDVRAKK